MEGSEKADHKDREVGIRKGISIRQEEYDRETERRQKARGVNLKKKKKRRHNLYF